MDLSGHRRFRAADTSSQAAGRAPDAKSHNWADRARIGEKLLAVAWAALASARAEAVDIHLQSGQVIANVLAVRTDGRMAEASCWTGQWTHAFAVEDVVLVRQVARGGLT
jgi:hypothetical protein